LEIFKEILKTGATEQYDVDDVERIDSLTRYEVEHIKQEMIDELKEWMLTEHSRKEYQIQSYSDILLANDRLAYEAIRNIKFATSLHIGKLDSIGITKMARSIHVSNDVFTFLNKGTTWKFQNLGVDTIAKMSRRFNKIYATIYKWHQEEFGDRFRGFHFDAPTEYRMDSEEYLKLYYYQKAMQSIIDFTERYNIPLGSPTIETKGILETIENNEESIMNYYQTGFSAKKAVAIHVLTSLARYLGFNPLTFTPLDDTLFDRDSNTGLFARHHFLAFLFRKMSSRAGHLILTSIDLMHSEYEGLFDDMGLFGAEIYMDAIMKVLLDLIDLKDGKGNWKAVDERDIERALVNHLGIVKGKELFREWTRKKKEFSENLKLFNDRRFKKKKDGYVALLKDNEIGFPIAWKRFIKNPRYLHYLIREIYPYLGSREDLKLLKEIRTSI
jgi:hypothetical protein